MNNAINEIKNTPEATNRITWRQRNTQQVKEQDKCPPNKRGRDREST